MNLAEYLSGPVSVADLARSISVAPSLVSQWKNEVRPIPTDRCASIEIATNGAVTRRDLRPDNWHLIWPELVTDQFPAPVATQEDRRTDTSPPHVMAEKRKAELIDKKDS